MSTSEITYFVSPPRFILNLPAGWLRKAWVFGDSRDSKRPHTLEVALTKKAIVAGKLYVMIFIYSMVMTSPDVL